MPDSSGVLAVARSAFHSEKDLMESRGVCLPTPSTDCQQPPNSRRLGLRELDAREDFGEQASVVRRSLLPQREACNGVLDLRIVASG